MKNRPRMANRHPRDFERACKAWPLHERALVVGDSWMRYDSLFPLSLFGGSSNLFKAVQRRHPMVSLSSSSNGNTLHSMLSDEGLGRIRTNLMRGPFTYLFFSGGGNDIVNALQGLVFEYDGFMSAPENAVKTYSVESMLYAMKNRLEALIDTKDMVSPGTRILVHNYGVPNLKAGGFRRLGVTWAGPWILPKLQNMGYSIGWAHAIIRDMMWRYDRMLKSLWPAVEVVDTASQLAPHHWRDEMHLTQEGYDVAARAFRPALQKRDANRGTGYR